MTRSFKREAAAAVLIAAAVFSFSYLQAKRESNTPSLTDGAKDLVASSSGETRTESTSQDDFSQFVSERKAEGKTVKEASPQNSSHNLIVLDNLAKEFDIDLGKFSSEEIAHFSRLLTSKRYEELAKLAGIKLENLSKEAFSRAAEIVGEALPETSNPVSSTSDSGDTDEMPSESTNPTLPFDPYDRGILEDSLSSLNGYPTQATDEELAELRLEKASSYLENARKTTLISDLNLQKSPVLAEDQTRLRELNEDNPYELLRQQTPEEGFEEAQALRRDLYFKNAASSKQLANRDN